MIQLCCSIMSDYVSRCYHRQRSLFSRNLSQREYSFQTDTYWIYAVATAQSDAFRVLRNVNILLKAQLRNIDLWSISSLYSIVLNILLAQNEIWKKNMFVDIDVVRNHWMWNQFELESQYHWCPRDLIGMVWIRM